MKLQRMETPKVQEVLMMIYDCRNKKRPKDSVVFEPADNESFAFHVPEIVHMSISRSFRLLLIIEC